MILLFEYIIQQYIALNNNTLQYTCSDYKIVRYKTFTWLPVEKPYQNNLACRGSDSSVQLKRELTDNVPNWACYPQFGI